MMSCSNEIETFDILIESDDKILNKQSEIKLAITLNGKVTNYDFESYLNNTDKPLLQFHSEEQTIEVHQDFYEKVLSESGVLA